MTAPRKAPEDRHVVKNISMPPGLWERTQKAARNLPVSRWWVEAAELKLALDAGDQRAIAQIVTAMGRHRWALTAEGLAAMPDPEKDGVQ